MVNLFLHISRAFADNKAERGSYSSSLRPLASWGCCNRSRCFSRSQKPDLGITGLMVLQPASVLRRRGGGASKGRLPLLLKEAPSYLVSVVNMVSPGCRHNPSQATAKREWATTQKDRRRQHPSGREKLTCLVCLSHHSRGWATFCQVCWASVSRLFIFVGRADGATLKPSQPYMHAPSSHGC